LGGLYRNRRAGRLPVGGVDFDVAEDLGLARDAEFLGHFQSVAHQLLERADLGKIFSSGNHPDAAFAANSVAVTGASHGQAREQELFHEIGARGHGALRDILDEANDWHRFHIASSNAKMQIERMERVIVLGASRGLGAELVKHILAEGNSAVGFSRKETPLKTLRALHPKFEFHLADFSTREGQDLVARFLAEESFTKVIAVAGGGPYGRFEERAWKDHQWAWDVSFQFPARVIHTLLSSGRTDKQLILVGSAVAEGDQDPMAASYSAAKHALKGLVRTVKAENPLWDIRLFSPGYMDTEMLPANAAVRQRGVYGPAQIARELWDWSLCADDTGHKVYPKHPS
jgi:short-subunit dehydrogenase